MDFLCPGKSKNGKFQSNILSDTSHVLDKEVVLEMVENGLDDSKIADFYNCSRITVFRFRKQHGIIVKKGGQRKGSGRNKTLTADHLDEIIGYVKDGLSNSEIADLFYCTARTIINFREEYGIDKEIEAQLKSLILSQSNNQAIYPPTLAYLAIKIGCTDKLIKAKTRKIGHANALKHVPLDTRILKVIQWRDACLLSYERIDNSPFTPYFTDEVQKCSMDVAGDGNSMRGHGGAKHNSHNSQIYSSIN